MQIKNNFTQSLVAATATAFLVMSATSAQAVLVGRDINGQAVANVNVVFLYDTDLNITWLRDANASATAGNTNNPGNLGYGGFMNWNGATAWANALVVGAFGGWRLPSTLQPDASCTDSTISSTVGTVSSGYGCTGSEMGHLWYTELGNTAGGLMSNTGDFQNLQPYYYWSGTEFAYSTDNAWVFTMELGYQGAFDKNTTEFLAMAVRRGDVLTDVNQVPEPGTLLLASLALAGMGIARRRRPAGASAL